VSLQASEGSCLSSMLYFCRREGGSCLSARQVALALMKISVGGGVFVFESSLFRYCTVSVLLPKNEDQPYLPSDPIEMSCADGMDRATEYTTGRTKKCSKSVVNSGPQKFSARDSRYGPFVKVRIER
jgi:hypothetical protein